MKPGDMVYYLYTDHRGLQTRYAAIILAAEDNQLKIRVGRYDVHSKEISTFESSVRSDSLLPRTIPCSYEAELAGTALPGDNCPVIIDGFHSAAPARFVTL